MSSHLVQYGILGEVGRFRSPDNRRYARDARVICRTERGLEVGTVLADVLDTSEMSLAGDLLRPITPEDELIIQRIERFRDRAFDACSQLIRQRGYTATLVDVEHLFDGQSVYFYFLGEVPEPMDELTGELADTYEAKVKFRKFTETLVNGCGPDCGTGQGCGDGNCQTCAVRGACRTG